MFDIIINTLTTDKSNKLEVLKKYTLIVKRKIRKNILKEEIIKFLNIKVKKVNIIYYKPKTKLVKGKIGKNKGFKKAIISIKTK
jgi:large subunit ribosomal protein L23